jgi:hypothetical protein
MFGIRRSNVSYKSKSELVKNNNLSKNLINNEQEEEEDLYKSTKYIFYDKKKFTDQMEIYISITNFNKKKVLIIISSDSSIEELNNQIVENLQSSPEFKNINGIKAEEIYKISHNNKIYLPQEGTISDFVNSGDILYCSLSTDEFWIKTYYNIQSFNFKKIIKLEYKLKKKMKYKKFKLMLMKGGIQLFIENLKTSYTGYIYNYYVKLFEFKIKKHKKVITHNIHNKQNYKMTIDKIINFSSEIIVFLKFEVFEKLIHKNIKITNSNVNNLLRVNEYNLLSFEDLANDTSYIPEITAIKELSEDFLKKQYNEDNPNFLFFNKKKQKMKKMSSDDFLITKKNTQYSLDAEYPLDELVEEDDEKSGDFSRNLNIDEIGIKQKNSLNEIRNTDTDSLGSDNIITTDKKKLKKKSYFSNMNNEIIEKELPKKKEKKEEKIKNMIIVANFLIKEEKKLLKKLNSYKALYYESPFDKNDVKQLRKTTYNKIMAIYDNRSNIDHLIGEEDENNSKKNNFILEGTKEDENNYEADTEIEFETKPRTLSDKKLFKNQLLYRTFNDSKNNEDDDFYLKIKDEEEADDNDKKILDYNLINNSNAKKSFNKNLKFNSEIGDEDKINNSSIELNEGENYYYSNSERRENYARQSGRRNSFVSKQKNSLLSKLRNKSSPQNFYKIIKSMFNDEEFLSQIKNYYNNTSTKQMIDKIKMPQSKDIEYLEKEYKFLIETTNNRQNDELKLGSGEFHIYVFMILLFLFSVLILISLNLDLISIFY